MPGRKAYYFAGLAFLPQRWPKILPVLVASTHGGMAGLRGLEWPEKYWDGRPARGGHQSQY